MWEVGGRIREKRREEGEGGREKMEGGNKGGGRGNFSFKLIFRTVYSINYHNYNFFLGGGEG